MTASPPAGTRAPARTYAVEVLGCKVNQYEAQQVREAAERRGLRPCAGGAPADVVVLHACIVTAEAARQSAQALRRLRRRHPGARVVLSGCGAGGAWPGGRPEGVRLAPAGPEWPRRLAAALDEAAPAAAGGAPGPLGRFAGHARAFLKVQDGCDLPCSYCIVPRLRGPPRDRPAAEVLEEARRLAGRGYAELVVTGVCVGLYGRRGSGAPPLARLLAALAAIPDVRRLRLSSLHPSELTAGLLAVWRDTPKIAPHLHLPLQSGSDRVLRLMRRGHTAAGFLRAVERARAALDRPAVTTDLIAGFPGENARDHEASERVCRAAAFARLHVFPFSVRPGTPAAALPGAVPVAEARARARRLRALGEELAAAHARGFAGATVGVLVERIDAAGVARGYSERYLPVAFASAGGRAGDVVPVRLDPGAAACFPLPRGYLAGSAEPAADRAAGDAP